jgi:hypothetical protein
VPISLIGRTLWLLINPRMYPNTCPSRIKIHPSLVPSIQNSDEARRVRSSAAKSLSEIEWIKRIETVPFPLNTHRVIVSSCSRRPPLRSASSLPICMNGTQVHALHAILPFPRDPPATVSFESPEIRKCSGSPARVPYAASHKRLASRGPLASFNF